MDNAAKERVAKLQAEYEAAKPADRPAIAEKIRVMTGKEKAPSGRITVVKGGQEWDAQAGAMRNVPDRLFDNDTGSYVDEKPAGQSIQSDPRAIAIRDNKGMTTAQKQEALKKLGYK